MRRSLMVLAALVFTMTLAPAAPAAITPFDAKAFTDAQNAGKSIVVMVHAPW